MGLFGRNKKEEKKAAAPAPAVTEKNPASRKATQDQGPALRSFSGAGELARVLKNPRITEKASNAQTHSVYTFDIAEGATKRQIMEAVRSIYHVTPRKVAVVRVPEKKRRNMRTGRRGISSGGRKAYVYLIKGETISLS